MLGASFYRGAYKSVMNGSANMDTLVVLGTSAAWLYGFILIFIGYQLPDSFYLLEQSVRDEVMRGKVHEHAHNFEISSTLITVILFGKCLEAYSKKQTVDKLTDLASLKVSKACLMTMTEAELSDAGKEIDIDLLVVGDIVKVIQGQTIPIDGTLVKGSGLVNESMLTGESNSMVKNIDSKVFGGTLLTRGSILVRVDKLADSAAIN